MISEPDNRERAELGLAPADNGPGFHERAPGGQYVGDTYVYRDAVIRAPRLQLLRRYAEEHIDIDRDPVLLCVIVNDLELLFREASDDDMRNWPAVVDWLITQAPTQQCWGSPDHYLGWIGK